MAEFSPAFGTVLQGAGTMSFVESFNWGLFTLPPGATIINQTVIQQATFILRGFYPTSGQYEIWSGTSRNTPPPSGHTLNDTTVIAELVGTGTY